MKELIYFDSKNPNCKFPFGSVEQDKEMTFKIFVKDGVYINSVELHIYEDGADIPYVFSMALNCKRGDESLVGAEGLDGGDKGAVGADVGRDEEVVLGHDGRIFLGQIVLCQIRISALDGLLPLLGLCHYAKAYLGNGAGEREGQQGSTHLVVVEEYDVSHLGND